MGRGQNLLNLVKSIKQQKELETVQEEIKEVIKPENLKAGITAFGIEGNKNIVDTGDANLYDYYLHPSYTGYSKGSKIKGRMNLSTVDNPYYFPSSQTILNPENPDFILIEHYSGGTIQGRVKTIKASAINSEWIENKNICIRANYNPSLTYWSKDWCVEIAVCENDCQFKFKSSSGEQPIYCVYRATGGGAPYTLYHARCDDLSELTIDSWTKKEVAVSSYMDSTLGKTGTLYAYSRDQSVATTGLTGSTGIMSSKGKIYFKNKLSANATDAFLNRNNGAFIDTIDGNKVAEIIGLKPEHIKKGETYLGVEGTMPDNNAMIKTSVAQQGSSSQILHCIEYLPDDLYVDSSTAQYLFAYMSSLKALPKNLNLSKVTQANYMCFRCYALEGNIKINVNNLTSIMDMFADCKLITSVEYFPTTANMFTELFDGCINLVEIPELNTANAAWSGMINPFRNCPKLSDNSLNNILAMCTKATAIAEAKTYANLKSTGLSQEQAAKCQTLSNWDAFVAAGWTTGYTELDTVIEE